MFIKPYEPRYLKQILDLFYETVCSINAKDYSPSQIEVWSNQRQKNKQWQNTLSSHYTLVAIIDTTLVGFGDIDYSGYLDHLYVHKDYQGIGIATKLCDELESFAFSLSIPKIATHSSITAKPFFEKRGFKLIKKQQVEKNHVMLTNFVMTKDLSSIAKER